MSNKTFIIDTNVFLHDPYAMLQFVDHDVVIPVTVLEELDKMKRFTDELGKNARHVLRYVDSLSHIGELYKGVKLDNGSILRIARDEKRNGEPFPLSIETKKDRILYIAFVEKQKGGSVVLVSKDLVTRVKAESIGIKAEDYLSHKESYDSLYRGLRRLDVEKRIIDEFLTQGGVTIEGEEFYPNEYIYLNSKEHSNTLCKFNSVTKQLEPLIPLSRDIWGINPLNDEQRCAIDLLLRDDIKLLSFVGQAGTGKTLLALTCGLKKVFDEDVYKKILISRPIMPLGRDIGYLPGTKEEKILHWMQPIYDNLDFLCETTSGEGNGKETKQWIVESEKIEMEAVTYIRGRSLSRAWIIIDEAQNLAPHEVKTIISRAGKGTKVILTGDPTQIDNPYLDKDSNALTYVVGRFKQHAIYGHIFFETTERSKLAALAAEIL